MPTLSNNQYPGTSAMVIPNNACSSP